MRSHFDVAYFADVGAGGEGGILLRPRTVSGLVRSTTCGVTFASRPGAHKAVDDDLVVGGQAAPDHPQSAMHLAKLDRFRHHGVLGIDRHDDFASLIGLDGDIGNEQRLVGATDCNLDPPKQSRCQKPIRIGHHGSQQHSAALCVEPVVGEVDIAVMGEIGLHPIPPV